MSYPEAQYRVFMDVTIGSTKAGRVVMDLYKNTPKATQNFHALCTGERRHPQTGKPLTFKNSIFHRVIPQFMCQGGDITKGNGTGGYSIYGQNYRAEINGNRHHVGALSSANAGSGPPSDGSQFFWCTSSNSFLNGKHCVFGRIVEGMDVVKKVESQGSPSGRTRQRCVISDCGELSFNQKAMESINSTHLTSTRAPAQLAGQQGGDALSKTAAAAKALSQSHQQSSRNAAAPSASAASAAGGGAAASSSRPALGGGAAPAAAKLNASKSNISSSGTLIKLNSNLNSKKKMDPVASATIGAARAAAAPDTASTPRGRSRQLMNDRADALQRHAERLLQRAQVLRQRADAAGGGRQAGLRHSRGEDADEQVGEKMKTPARNSE